MCHIACLVADRLSRLRFASDDHDVSLRAIAQAAPASASPQKETGQLHGKKLAISPVSSPSTCDPLLSE